MASAQSVPTSPMRLPRSKQGSTSGDFAKGFFRCKRKFKEILSKQSRQTKQPLALPQRS